MTQTTLVERAEAVVIATIGKTPEVANHILKEFTEFLPELPYIEEVSYEVGLNEGGGVECSLLINFTNGPTKTWTTVTQAQAS